MNINKFNFEDLIAPSSNISIDEQIQADIKQETTLPEDQSPITETPIAESLDDAKKRNEIFEEKVALIKENSFNDGYSKAQSEFDHKKLESEKHTGETLERISTQLAILSSDQTKYFDQAKLEMLTICVKLVEKLTDSISDSVNQKIFSMIDSYLLILKDESQVIITLNPKTKDMLLSKIQDLIDNISKEQRFIIKDSSDVQESDCVISWGTGNIEFNKQRLMDKILALSSK